jgi:hypothetical protein
LPSPWTNVGFYAQGISASQARRLAGAGTMLALPILPLTTEEELQRWLSAQNRSALLIIYSPTKEELIVEAADVQVMHWIANQKNFENDAMRGLITLLRMTLTQTLGTSAPLTECKQFFKFLNLQNSLIEKKLQAILSTNSLDVKESYIHCDGGAIHINASTTSPNLSPLLESNLLAVWDINGVTKIYCVFSLLVSSLGPYHLLRKAS